MAGEHTDPVVTPDPKDKRFADPEWSQNQFFDFLKQAYLLTAQWGDRLVKDAAGVDELTRKKAEFYVKQIANAISPSNFVLTNPELLRETLSSNAENLVRGMHMLSEDIKAGHGNLKIRQSDPVNVRGRRATSRSRPARSFSRTSLIQLIQYEATTKEVLKTPLLIVPPWINKFYILDLTPDKSFIKWCVDQGITVFVVSWVNPDARLAQKSFEEYMREGVIAALDAVEAAIGEKQVNAIGYCVGGTLLSITLAYLAAKKQRRVKSATLFAAQVDFTYAGDLMVFVDEERIKQLEVAYEGTRLSGSLAHGEHLQHAAFERSDLAVHRQQLHARQESHCHSIFSTGIPMQPECRPPIIPSICAIVISITSSPKARWKLAASRLICIR